jgi:hypothetical protein
MSDQKNDVGKSRPALVKGHFRVDPWAKSVILRKLVVRPEFFRLLSSGGRTRPRGESGLESPSSGAKPQPDDGATPTPKKAE